MKPVRWTTHARKECARREVAAVEVEKAITQPDSVVPGNPPRWIFMRRYFDETLETEMLLRVVTEEVGEETVIVTRMALS